VSVSPTVSFTDSTLTASLIVDLGSSGRQLGSYGAALTWDPTELEYLAHSSGGQPPFDSPAVNDSNTANGELRLADAAPLGAGGRVLLLSATFRAVARPCISAALDLQFTSLFAAATFEDLLPLLTVRGGTVDITDFTFDLRAVGTSETLLAWNPIRGALSYDVIRGGVWSLLAEPLLVHLGSVVCLEDASRDTTTGAGIEPANPDRSTPLPGRSFFYLVRFENASTLSGYGFAARCARERVVDTGDCP
jgi:hypothetical protein